MPRPKPNDYPSFYAGYVEETEGDDPVKILEEQITRLQVTLSTVSEEKGEFSYAEGKWTIKEMIGHLIDTEKIMAYRALCIARGEKQSLPGFEQDDYVKEGNFNRREMKELMEELLQTRRSTILLFKSFEKEMLNRRGVANENEVTVLAFAFIITGHANHHIRILKEKYMG